MRRTAIGLACAGLLFVPVGAGAHTLPIKKAEQTTALEAQSLVQELSDPTTYAIAECWRVNRHVVDCAFNTYSNSEYGGISCAYTLRVRMRKLSRRMSTKYTTQRICVL